MKEKASKTSYGARLICGFWRDTIRNAGEMAKPGTIDACLTIHERLLCIPECDAIIRMNDEKYGRDSVWSLWKLQEIVYRGQKKDRILWSMLCIDDGLKNGRLSPSDVSITAIKTGPKSLTDVYIQSWYMKKFLLGAWLDQSDFPSYMKTKARDIFANHTTYRE
eukprot:3541434-Karenia_brevis.AAC.1